MVESWKAEWAMCCAPSNDDEEHSMSAVAELTSAIDGRGVVGNSL